MEAKGRVSWARVVDGNTERVEFKTLLSSINLYPVTGDVIIHNSDYLKPLSSSESTATTFTQIPFLVTLWAVIFFLFDLLDFKSVSRNRWVL